MEQYRFRFKIDDLTLETVPMKRVLEYLGDLATLVGEQQHVHLAEIKTGSIETVIETDAEAAPKIEQRVREATRSNGIEPTGPQEAIHAAQKLAELLHEDRTGAVFMYEAGAEIVRFENGHRETAKQIFGPFYQEGTLDGVVVRLGGINDPVPVHLESDEGSYQCLASRSVARELANHIFETTLRVYGQGRWLRSSDGEWHLESFTIRDFHALVDETAGSALARLRAVPGNEWNDLDDPLGEAAKLRNDEDDQDDGS